MSAWPLYSLLRVVLYLELGVEARRRVRATRDLVSEREKQSALAGDGDDDGLTTTMLLKPKVVLDTVVYELGLVDEEDASPSTAEPSEA